MRTLIKYLNDEGFFGWNYKYILTHPWIIAIELKRWIIQFCQRGWRGYAYSDVWDIHSYLMRWLPNAIKDLRKNTHGYPIGLSAKRWDKILKDMEQGLKDIQKYINSDYPVKQHRLWQKKADKGLKFFIKYFYHLWD